MKKLLISIILLLTGSKALMSQNTSNEPLWIQFMLEPNPNYFKVKAAFDDYWKDSVPTKGYGYKVFKRWEYHVKPHISADGTVNWPQHQLTDFVNSYKPTAGGANAGATGGGGSNGAAACPQNGRWEPVGPIINPYNQTGQPTGIGRVAGVCLHPKDSNTFFVCAPQGGVWKTQDHGMTWAQIFTSGSVVNTIGATSMVISYNNTDTMYIGTGDRDAGDAPSYGVIASWDGGKTWVTRNASMGNVAVGRMVMDPKNSAILLAATNGGVYRSTNSGSTWSLVLSGSAWDIVFHPFNRNIVYASINGYFYKSTDNGVSWTQSTSGLPGSSYRGMIAVSKNNRAYVYFLTTAGSAFQGLYRSTDSGSTFSTMSTTPNILGYSETGSDASGQGWYDMDVTADPANANTVIVSGINIWKSTNGGANWSIIAHWVGNGGADDVHADQHCIEWSINGNKLYGGNDGGIYFTTNKGALWYNVSSGIQNSQIYRIAQAQTNPFITAQGYQDNGSAQSERDRFYTYYGGDGMDCAVDPTDATYVYGSYVYGRIYRAINKTTTRTLGVNGTNGINEGGAWLTPFILQEGNPSRMFAGYVNVWRCDNVKASGTITWTKISTGWSSNVFRLANSRANNKLLYAVRGDGRFYYTTDATVASPSWTDITSTKPGTINDVAAHHKIPGTVYVCTPTDLYRSTNYGSSWVSIATLPASSGNMQTIIIDSSSAKERLYIGSKKGVYVWDSATSSVIPFNTGFPTWGDVSDLDIYYSPKGKTESRIVASTYGRGVWRSNLYDDGTAKPKSGFYAFDSVFVVGSKLKLYEKIQNSASSVKWKITPYTYSYVEGTDSTSLIPVIKFTSTGLYSIRLVATNCQGSDTAEKKNWIKVFSAPANYNCTNYTGFQTVNYNFGILNFSLTDNSSETGGLFDDGVAYDQSSEKVFRIKPSVSNTASIKTGTYYNEYVRIFADYDNNGKFENYKGEAVASTTNILGTRSVAFTPPSNLKKNQGLRMRVVADYYALDTNAACAYLYYSQSEDYTLVYDFVKPDFYANKTSTCVGENIVFRDTSEGLISSYEWDFGSGASPATAVGKGPFTVKYTTTGNKSVKLKINGLDTVRKTSYISVSAGPDPIVVVKSGIQTGCKGRSITLAARNKNAGAFTVQWQKNGSNISGKTDTLLTLNNIADSDTGNYRVLLSNGSCTVQSLDLKISNDPNPVPLFSANKDSQCYKGNNFIFTNNSTIKTGTFSSAWTTGDGGKQSGTNAQRNYAAAGTYIVKLVLTSNKGCKDSLSKPITIYPNATMKFTVNDSDQCMNANSFVFTNTSSISSGSLSYLWQFGDATNTNTISPTKTYSSNGIYTVLLIGTSNKGCIDSVSKPTRVYSKPVSSFTINAFAACLKGNNFSFTNNSSNTDGTLSYIWNFGDGKTSTSNNPTTKYSTAGTFKIQLKATSSFGCTDSSFKNVNLHPQANVAYTVNDSDQCLNANNFIFTNKSNIASGSLSYNWSFGDFSVSTAISPSHSYFSAGTFTSRLITLSNNNCRDTAYKNIRVYHMPVAAFSVNNSTQCLKGNSFLFTDLSSNTDGSLSYLWRFGNGNTSKAKSPQHWYGLANTYKVWQILTTSYGCMDSISQNITVHPKASLNFTTNDSDQCLSGNNFKFTNLSTISNGIINSYLWNFGDLLTSSSASPSHTYAVFGTYNVAVFAVSNTICRDTLMKTIRVYAQPKAAFTTLPSLQQCFKFHKLTSTSTSTVAEGTLNHTWKFGDGNSQSGDVSAHTYAVSATYPITLISKSSYGCVDSIVKQAQILASPQPAFTMSKNLLCEKVSTNTKNTSSISSGTLTYAWQFGNKKSSTLADDIISYDSFGFYTILLETTSNLGCKDSTSLQVEVASLPKAIIALAPAAGCATQTTFNITSNSVNRDGRGISVNWNLGDSTIGSSNSMQHKYLFAGNKIIKLIAQSSICADTSTFNLLVNAPIKASFTTEEINKESKRFIATDTSIIGYTYVWHFGDGKSDTGKKVNHQYSKNDTFSVQLHVSNNIGCKDSSIKNAVVLSPNYKVQNNAFDFYIYPNPTNDKFTYKFVVKETRTMEVALYDVVGQSAIYSKVWKDIPAGTYFETIDLNKLQVAAGTYPFVIKSGAAKETVKTIFTK